MYTFYSPQFIIIVKYDIRYQFLQMIPMTNLYDEIAKNSKLDIWRMFYI